MHWQRVPFDLTWLGKMVHKKKAKMVREYPSLRYLNMFHVDVKPFCWWNLVVIKTKSCQEPFVVHPHKKKILSDKKRSVKQCNINVKSYATTTWPYSPKSSAFVGSVYIGSPTISPTPPPRASTDKVGGLFLFSGPASYLCDAAYLQQSPKSEEMSWESFLGG